MLLELFQIREFLFHPDQILLAFYALLLDVVVLLADARQPLVGCNVLQVLRLALFDAQLIQRLAREEAQVVVSEGKGGSYFTLLVTERKAASLNVYFGSYSDMEVRRPELPRREYLENLADWVRGNQTCGCIDIFSF